MAHLQRVLFLSKRLNTTFRHVYLNCIYRRQALHKQDGVISPTSGKSNFYLLNSFAVRNLEHMSKSFCTLTKDEVSENMEMEDDKNVPSSKSLDEINLSDNDLMDTFRNLYRIYSANKFNRNSNFENKLQAFVETDEFKNFCDSLEKRLPLLSAQELKFLLRLDVFKVSTSSVLMQKIYHLVIEKINEYTPLDIISIYLSIHSISHKKNSTSKVLKLVCERYFNSKLLKNIILETDYNKMAYYMKASKLPLSIKKKLLGILAKDFQTIQSELTLSSLAQLLGSFTSRDLKGYFKPEMYDLLKSRAETEEMNYIKIRNTLTGLNYLMGNEISYDEGFLNILAEKALARGFGVTNTSDLISCFLKIGYVPWSLVRNLEQMLAGKNFILESQKLAFRIAKILSCAYFHPSGYRGDDANHIECLKKLEPIDISKFDMTMYVTWCLFLTALGSQRKIEKINELFNFVTEAYMNKNIKDDLSASTVEAIITLHAFARRNFPDEVVELSETFLKKCYDALKTESVKDMHGALCKLIDTSTAREYCTTSMYHFIDFAVLLDQEKKPLEITVGSNKDSSDGIFRIDDIKKTLSSKLILYQIYRGDLPGQFRNSSDLPGVVRLYLEAFEPLQCKVVLLLENEYRRLDPKQQRSYLVKKINESMQ